MGFLLTPEGAAKRPVAAALVASAIAGVGATIVAYERFAHRNIPFALAFGLFAAGAVFVGVYQRARAARIDQPAALGAVRESSRLRPISWFEALMAALSLVLVVLAAILSTWSLLVPSAIFAGLVAGLVLLRRVARRRVK